MVSGLSSDKLSFHFVTIRMLLYGYIEKNTELANKAIRKQY